jgi:putative DNA-invertase from lambdoid prophage Rac
MSNQKDTARPYRIFGYARTSTERQELSLEEQAERVRQRASALEEQNGGAKWVGCYSEQESATTVSWQERPQLKALTEEIEDGDVLIVWRLSRIDRQPWRMITALDYFTRRRIRVIALELEFAGQGANWELDLDTTMGRTLVMLMAMVAEWWLGGMREDVRAALARLKAQGFGFGPEPPLGKRFERVYLPNGQTTRGRRGGRTFRDRPVWDEEQCGYVREVWVRHKLFGQTLADIARDFIRRGVTTATGKPWAKSYRRSERNGGLSPDRSRDPVIATGRLGRAVTLVDELMSERALPSQLRIDEYSIRAVAARLCDPQELQELLEKVRNDA